VVKIANYTSYYLYALERYKSLQEILAGKDVYEPEWYNKGVEHLMAEQHEEGWWSAGCGAECDTAAAVLIASRSTKKSLGSLGEGYAFGGIGDLPKDLSKLKVRGDRIVTEQARTDVSDLLKMLDDEKMADLEGVLVDPSALVVENVDEKDLRRLRQLVHSGEPVPRLLAIRALGQTSDLD